VTIDRTIPRYAVAGLLAMSVSEIGMLLQVEPFWTWHTAISWTGYILFVDGVVWRHRGDSWLTSAPWEFAFLATLSIPLWLVFEFYNLFIRNWHYVNLPETRALRWFGYAWSFATIWPAIFETGELVAIWRSRRKPAAGTAVRGAHPIPWTGRMVGSVIAGAALLAWPLLWPSPWLAAPVWLGFIFLLDPINARLGGESLTGDWRAGAIARTIDLSIAGLICGVVWEFWNFWARAKWIYSVPIMQDVRVFEMPLPGYLGFPAFALECFVMYVTVRRLFWRGPARPISL
jgi:hypothetical protein